MVMAGTSNINASPRLVVHVKQINANGAHNQINDIIKSNGAGILSIKVSNNL